MWLFGGLVFLALGVIIVVVSLHPPEDILRGRKTRFRFYVDDTRVHMPQTLHFPGVVQVIEQSMRDASLTQHSP